MYALLGSSCISLHALRAIRECILKELCVHRIHVLDARAAILGSIPLRRGHQAAHRVQEEPTLLKPHRPDVLSVTPANLRLMGRRHVQYVLLALIPAIHSSPNQSVAHCAVQVCIQLGSE